MRCQCNDKAERQILDPIKKNVGRQPTIAVMIINTTARTNCIVMKQSRIENAGATREIIQTVVKSIALGPGFPPMKGKSLMKSSLPFLLAMC